MTQPILCQTIGLELEVENIRSDQIPKSPNYHTTHDASVESDAYFSSDIDAKIKLDKDLRSKVSLQRKTLGTEIVTGILDTNSYDYLNILKKLTAELTRLGESPRSYRAGIHIHISYGGFNLDILKSLTRLAAHLEPVFFLVGGMGYEFRGIKNDSAYCRPITKYGPPVVETRRGKAQCLNIDDILESRTVDEFRERWGNLNRLGGNRYIPIRYLWFNLFNLWNSNQTVEFRIFNKTLDPLYIFSVIELCKAFGRRALEMGINGEYESISLNSVYDNLEKDEIIEVFLKFSDQAKLQSYATDHLLDIMNLTPIESIRFPEKFHWSHLRFHRGGNRSPIHWEDGNYIPEIITKNCFRPDFVDIHNLRADSGEEVEAPRFTIPDLSSYTTVNYTSGTSNSTGEWLEEEEIEEEEL